MISEGSTVRMHYTLSVDGAVVDSSAGGEPLEYVQGEGHIIPGLEQALSSSSLGDKRQVTIPPEQGYGPVSPDLVQKVPRAAFKEAAELSVGAVVSGQAPGGMFRAVVVDLTETDVTLDLNHPLAGKTLVFDVEVVSVSGPMPGFA